MSIAPDRVLRASGPRGAPYAPGAGHGDTGDAPQIRSVAVLSLQPGDRLLVHADAAIGLSAGGASKLATQLADLLQLDQLGFDVPVCVAAPGLRVEVLRPA